MSSQLRRIFVLDDDDFNLEVAEVALTTVGSYEVRTFSSGADMLAAAGQQAPDLLLSDVRMPAMTGPAAFAELRKLPGCNTTPVVFMTADNTPAEVQSLMDLGAAAVLPKPLDAMQLATQIQAAWDELE